MTCVIAITDGQELVFAADCASSNLKTGEIYNMANEKIFACGPWLIGHTTSYRLGQVLRHRVIWPIPPLDLELLEAFVVGEVVDAVRKAMREAGAARRHQSAENGGTFLLGYGGRIFVIADDYSVVRLPNNFAAIGHGRFLAHGALFALKESPLPLEERCRIALEAAAAYDNTVRGPFSFLRATGTGAA